MPVRKQALRANVGSPEDPMSSRPHAYNPKKLRLSSFLSPAIFSRQRIGLFFLGMMCGLLFSSLMGFGPSWMSRSSSSSQSSSNSMSSARSSSRAVAKSPHNSESACPIPAGTAPFNPPSSITNFFGGRPRNVRVAFASHPRSGSTWSRILIERLTGMPTAIERESWVSESPSTMPISCSTATCSECFSFVMGMGMPVWCCS